MVSVTWLNAAKPTPPRSNIMHQASKIPHGILERGAKQNPAVDLILAQLPD
jgi:hypothetical protein